MRLINCLLLGILSPLSLYPATLSGNRVYPEHELLEYLSTHDVHFTDLSRADLDQLKRSRELLEFFYQDRGYLLAEVKTAVPPLIFRIVEGPKVASIRVEPEGNCEIGDKELRRFLGDSTRISRIEEGVRKIQKAYRDRGFLKATLNGPFIEVVESSSAAWPIPIPGKVARYRARLKLSIFEGPRFRYGRVQLPALHQDLPLQFPAPGSYYSEAKLVDFRKSLEKHFRMKGSFLSDLQIRQQLNQLTRSVDLTVSFRVLAALSVRTIEFTGHEVFPDAFYRRELRLRETELLDPQELDRSLDALRGTGALTSLDRDDVEIVIDEHTHEADLIIHLREKDRQRVQFSAGPDGLHNLELSLLYTIFNLIGLEEKMGLQLQIGSNMSELALGTTFRHLVGSSLPLDLALGFFRRNTGLRLPGVDEHRSVNPGGFHNGEQEIGASDDQQAQTEHDDKAEEARRSP